MTATVYQRNGNTCHFSPYQMVLTTIRKVRNKRGSFMYYFYCNQQFFSLLDFPYFLFKMQNILVMIIASEFKVKVDHKGVPPTSRNRMSIKT